MRRRLEVYNCRVVFVFWAACRRRTDGIGVTCRKSHGKWGIVETFRWRRQTTVHIWTLWGRWSGRKHVSAQVYDPPAAPGLLQDVVLSTGKRTAFLMSLSSRLSSWTPTDAVIPQLDAHVLTLRLSKGFVGHVGNSETELKQFMENGNPPAHPPRGWSSAGWEGLKL